MHRVSSNNSQGRLLYFLHKKGWLFKERRLFQILVTGSCALYILFYYPIKTRKIKKNDHIWAF